MPLVKRLIKGSTLTYQEMDDNLSYLDNKVSGSSGYITRFSGSTALTSSLLNQIASTVFVYGSFNVSQSLTVNNSSVVTLASPSYYIATGSVTASVDINSSKIFSITSASVNFGQINKTLTNTSFGQETLPASATGYGNAAFGYRALRANTSGIANIAIGYGALLSNTDGDENVAIGGNALEFNTLGSYNTAIGTAALDLNNADNNTALGYSSGFSNVTGSNNVFLGYKAGFYETNSNRLYISNSDTTSPLIKGNFSTGLLQLFTPTGTEITGPLTTTGEINASGFRGSITISPNYRYISLQDPTDPFGNLVALYLSGSGIVSTRLPYLQLGDLGLNINDQVNILSTGVKITGSLDVSTSASRFVLTPSTKDLSWIDSTDDMNQFSIYLSGSNDNRQVLLQSGDKGFNLDDKLKVTSAGAQITGSFSVNTANKSLFTVNPSSRYLSFTDFDDLFGNNFFVYLSGSNSNNEILIQTGDKGLSVDNRLKVVSTGTQITGSLIVSGSARITGSFAITGSGRLNNCNILTDCDTGSFLKTTSTGFGNTSYYGSFYHTSSQLTSAPNTPTPVSMSSTDFAYGISISGSNSDKIKFASGGYYDIQFSAQMAKTTGTSATAYFWLRKNGNDIAWSNTGITLAGGSNDVATPAWNLFLSASANDFYQLMWSANTTNPFITSSLSVGGGPEVPSIIVTVNRVG